jgi:hypothetical protein
VYRAANDESDYRLLGYTDKTQFLDEEYSEGQKACIFYRVTAVTNENVRESVATTVFISAHLDEN